MSESYKIFQDLCKRKDVRPADVSKATGIATSTFTSWKQDVYEPKPEKMKKIADYFGVTPEYLMYGETSTGYYYDKETAELAQQIYQDKEMHMLFDAVKGSTAEEIKDFRDMILLMKRRERGD